MLDVSLNGPIKIIVPILLVLPGKPINQIQSNIVKSRLPRPAYRKTGLSRGMDAAEKF